MNEVSLYLAWAVIIIEHLLLGLKLFLAWIVPDTPHWVTVERATRDFEKERRGEKIKEPTMAVSEITSVRTSFCGTSARPSLMAPMSMKSSEPPPAATHAAIEVNEVEMQPADGIEVAPAGAVEVDPSVSTNAGPSEVSEAV